MPMLTIFAFLVMEIGGILACLPWDGNLYFVSILFESKVLVPLFLTV